MKKECPICGARKDKKHMLFHIKNTHGGYKGVKDARKKLKECKMDPTKQLLKSDRVDCPYCRKSYATKNLKHHIKEWHPKDFYKDFPLTPRQKLNSLLNPDKRNASNDIFATSRVVSGGGFGVGNYKK
ncbi:TPA: hypothetical protein I7292_24280 [Vibrio parahaemolyticus]|nr:hypothetical protein [Vibrio parahaemolyticus]HAS7008675.1 hypothetical protein [Vibrio parahaemolyticus]